MSQVFRIGLVGARGSGPMRARALSRIDEARVVAVADTDVTAAADVARSLGDRHHHDVRVVANAMELAEDDAMDAVIMSTPPVLHEALGLACLRAGKHVLCEQPLAPNVRACERLVNAAADTQRCLATSFMLRHSPAARLARELVDDGAIGRIDHVRAFHGHNGIEYFGTNWSLDARTTGGGTLMSGGHHMIDQVRWFLGDVCEVVGYATEGVWRQPGCEDNGFLLMRTADGRVGRVHSSWSEWRRYRYRVEVYGNAGYVRFGYSPLWLEHAQGEPGRRMKVRRHLFPVFQVIERWKGWEWSVTNMFEADIRDWLQAAASGTEAPASGRDGLEAVRAAHSATRLASRV